MTGGRRHHDAPGKGQRPVRGAGAPAADVSRKRIALARLADRRAVAVDQRLDVALGCALQEIGEPARQVPAVAMHDKRRCAGDRRRPLTVPRVSGSCTIRCGTPRSGILMPGLTFGRSGTLARRCSSQSCWRLRKRSTSRCARPGGTVIRRPARRVDPQRQAPRTVVLDDLQGQRTAGDDMLPLPNGGRPSRSGTFDETERHDGSDTRDSDVWKQATY